MGISSTFPRTLSMTAQSVPEFLLKALRQALKPMVRLMLAKGVGYPQFAELMKELYVGVAEREFRIDGKEQTDSRISLLTGIHRKDVKRLRAMPEEEQGVPESVSLGMRLVSAWSEPPFATRDGHQLPLPRLGRQGGEVSFDSLVASVSKDIRARAVLDEWLRLGVVSVDDADRVVLTSGAFVPSSGLEEKAFYFGHNLHDHAAAATHNVLGFGEPWLERSVHYDALPPEVIARLRAEASDGAMRLLQDLNHQAMAAEQAGPGGEDARRFTFGVYFYAEKAMPDDPDSGSGS